MISLSKSQNLTQLSCLIRGTLESKPQEFTLKDSGRKCKLAKIEDEHDSYHLWIDDTLVTELPPAPPLAKDDIPVVCKSENFEMKGEVISRVTYNVFVEGILSSIVAEHNRRSLCTMIEVNGKIEK